MSLPSETPEKYEIDFDRFGPVVSGLTGDFGRPPNGIYEVIADPNNYGDEQYVIVLDRQQNDTYRIKRWSFGVGLDRGEIKKVT